MRRHFIHLPDRDLVYLRESSELFDDYIEAIDWAQKYARENREQCDECVAQTLAKFPINQEAVN